MKKLIVGNWKMHGSLASNQALLTELLVGLPQPLSTDVALCASAPYLAQLQTLLQGSPLA